MTSLETAIAHAQTDFWATGARLAIRQLALTGRGFDADHVLDMVGLNRPGLCGGS